MSPRIHRAAVLVEAASRQRTSLYIPTDSRGPRHDDEESQYEIQALRTTLRKNSAIMETQRVDLGTYKSGFSRLESKYNNVVAELDEAHGEIVERESEIENATQANYDLRAQIDRLNGELAEAESATTKAEAERYGTYQESMRLRC